VDARSSQRSLRPSTVRASQAVKARQASRLAPKTPKAQVKTVSPRSPHLPGCFPEGPPSAATTTRSGNTVEASHEEDDENAEVFIAEHGVDDRVLLTTEDQGSDHVMGEAVPQLSKAFWRLELPEDDRFDGEDDNVEEFVSRLRGEVGLAVSQGHLDNEDEAVKHMSNRLFSGTALTWLYDEGRGYDTLEGFLEGLQEWFGDRASGTQKRLALLNLKKKSTESARAFALRLKAGNKRLPQASRLTETELKYALLSGARKKGWLVKKVFRGKRYDHNDVGFDEVVERLLDQGQGSDDDDQGTRRELSETQVTKIAEQVAKTAAQEAAKETTAGMQKELSAVKEELRLTAAQHRTRQPPKRVFNVEELPEDGHPDEEHDDVYVAAHQPAPWRGQRNPPYRSQEYDRQKRPYDQGRPWVPREEYYRPQDNRPQAPAGSEHDAVLRDLLKGQQQMQQLFQQFLNMQVGAGPASTGSGGKDSQPVHQGRPDDQGRPGFPPRAQ
jgi:hypothetical protein